MKNNFDLHKWKEYQLFLNEQEEFSLGTDDLELAKKFNIKYLTIGDIITPGMWNTEFGDYLDQNDVDEEFRGDVWKITNIEDENWDGEDFPHATLESNNGGEIYENVSILNSMLNTPYQIELPLDESFSLSDDDLELAKGFNVKELTIGDTIESYMVNDSGISGLTSKMSRKIVDIVGDSKDIVVLVDPQNPSKVQHWLLDILNNDYLKPEYQIVDFISLNEAFELSDDDLELAKNFNIKYLTKDSTITPNMWDQNKIKNKAYTDLDFDENWKITDFDEDWSGDGEEETISVFLEDEDGWEISEYIENINLWLKPQFQVEEQLNETFELSDDDLELAKDFNIKELKPGDTIEPEMWNDFFGDDLQTRSAYISNIYDDEDGEVVTLHQNGYDFDFDLEDINDYLKPKYRIIDSLDESFELGDEDIELAKGFNQKELKVGNYFYDSTNPEYAGAWTKLEDAPSLIRNFVKKLFI